MTHIQPQPVSTGPRAEQPIHQYSLVYGLLGLVLGAAISWALLLSAIDRAAPWVDIFLHIILPALGFAVAGLAVLFIFALRMLRRLFERSQGTLEQVVHDASAAAEAAADRDASKAVHHAGRTALEVAAWYGPILARRGMMQASLAVLIAFGGLAGTALLFRQTVLLGEQNKKIDLQLKLLHAQNAKIDLQTLTAEAQRRGSLSPELFAILQLVSDLKPELKDLPTESPLLSRIVAFTRHATPYWTVETHLMENGEISEPHRATRPRSPERGQLLVGLVLNKVDLDRFAQIATFAGADLRQAELYKAKLRNVDLSQADLSGAELFGADLNTTALHGANLADARLVFAQLARANLNKANLTNANLRGATLSGAHLIEANLDRADLTGAELVMTILRKANLTNADLTSVDLSGADLSGADLTNAIVGNRDDRRPSAPPGWMVFDDGKYFRLRRALASP